MRYWIDEYAEVSDEAWNNLRLKPREQPTLVESLFATGVTQVTEEWHSLLQVEFTMEGDFADEDVAECLYQHIPVMYTLKGTTEKSIKTEFGRYTAWFTRG